MRKPITIASGASRKAPDAGGARGWTGVSPRTPSAPRPEPRPGILAPGTCCERGWVPREGRGHGTIRRDPGRKPSGGVRIATDEDGVLPGGPSRLLGGRRGRPPARPRRLDGLLVR